MFFYVKNMFGIMWNKKYVKMDKKTFRLLLNTLLYDWNYLDGEAQKNYIKMFNKILDN